MYQARIKNVLSNMEKMGIRQMLICDYESIYYLTGYYNQPMERLFALYLSADGSHKFFLNKLFPMPDSDIEKIWFTDTDDYVKILADNVDSTCDMGVDKLLPARFLLPLMEHNPDCRYILASDCVDDARACKDKTEQALMREVSQINDMAMDAAREFIYEGMTEIELAEFLLGQYQLHGTSAGLPLVAFGKNAADPHHHADGTTLKAGDCIVIDTGSKLQYYNSDMTRTYFCKEVSEEHQKIYNTVLEATLLAESMIRPGVPLCELDRAAREHIAAAGYGENFTHRLGHFIGQNVHEQGDVSATSSLIAKPGMIFSIEPGIYVVGDVGVRIEDLVLVTEDGCELLNRLEKDLILVG